MKVTVRESVELEKYPHCTRNLQIGQFAYMEYAGKEVVIFRTYDSITNLEDLNCTWGTRNDLPKFKCRFIPPDTQITVVTDK